MGNFDDKGEDHGVVMSQPIGVAPGSSNPAVSANSETRREEANPSPNSGEILQLLQIVGPGDSNCGVERKD